MKEIILASASPRRKELLNQIGLEFSVLFASGEELITETEPSLAVQRLAQEKAGAVFDLLQKKEPTRAANGVVIGADTVVAFEGKMLGKPKNTAEAARMISRLAGNTHQVYTGVSIQWEQAGEKKEVTFYECTHVTVCPMSKEEVLSYVLTGECADKAGAYGIQGRFAAFVQKIDGDYNNVVGLPVGRVYQELKKAGLN